MLFIEVYEHEGFSRKDTKTETLCGILLCTQKSEMSEKILVKFCINHNSVSFAHVYFVCEYTYIYRHILCTHQINLPVILSLRHLMPYPHSEVTLPFPQIRNKKGSKG